MDTINERILIEETLPEIDSNCYAEFCRLTFLTKVKIDCGMIWVGRIRFFGKRGLRPCFVQLKENMLFVVSEGDEYRFYFAST